MIGFWDDEKIFFDGESYFDELIKDIDSAREYITVEIYLFKNDELGYRLAHHLTLAHQRGVKVQIFVDGIGSHDFYQGLHTRFESCGIQVKMYNPLPILHPFFGQISFRKRLGLFASRFWRLNRRDHRKIITIDSRIMYTGSFNFTNNLTGLAGEKEWKDLGARVTGINVEYAVLHFKKSWRIRDYYRYRKILRWPAMKAWKLFPIRLNTSLLQRRFYYSDLQNRLKKAKKRIWLTSPYFIPRTKIVKLLAKAAKRGVDVRILMSAKSDVKIFHTLQFFYYEFLLGHGVRIFQYTDTVLHAKSSIIDDWITIGSSNLNHRSILHDLEVDLVIQNNENLLKIEEDFLLSTRTQLEITHHHLKQRSLFDKFLARLFFTFKYWF